MRKLKTARLDSAGTSSKLVLTEHKCIAGSCYDPTGSHFLGSPESLWRNWPWNYQYASLLPNPQWECLLSVSNSDWHTNQDFWVSMSEGSLQFYVSASSQVMLMLQVWVPQVLHLTFSILIGVCFRGGSSAEQHGFWLWASLPVIRHYNFRVFCEQQQTTVSRSPLTYLNFWNFKMIMSQTCHVPIFILLLFLTIIIW